jgi:serine/threonine-protein kinase HipA
MMTTMPPAERHHPVLMHGRRVGTLCRRGDHTKFVFSESYLADPARPVLGLRLEERLRRPYAAALRLPPWFSNLLPESPLRQWIANDRGVSADREMELLAQVGHDLPGALRVLPAEDDGPAATRPGVWRFSLAGVALKFSMLARGDRLTVPAVGERGDWLVKFPDYRFAHVPWNEHATMSLARAVGIEVPDVRMVHRDELAGLPARMWPNDERWAYAVRRFDRDPDNRLISVHIEDLAQVRDVYPNDKYEGTFETVSALVYRGHDRTALQEAARRLAFSVLVGNGDAHLKNWSLIYRDRRVPTLSPAYDLVSTFLYRAQDEEPEDLGLRLDGTRRFDRIGLGAFAALERRLDRRFGPTAAGLVDVAAETAELLAARWPEHREAMAGGGRLRVDVLDAWIGGGLGRFGR